MLERAPYEAPRRTIDVSGDGTNNSGRDVTLARDEAVAQGVTINGLVILSDAPMAWNPEHTNPPGGLANYYRSNVIGGPGAFVMVAENYNSFGQAIVKKLIAEIAELPPRRRPRPRPAAERPFEFCIQKFHPLGREDVMMIRTIALAATAVALAFGSRRTPQRSRC